MKMQDKPAVVWLDDDARMLSLVSVFLTHMGYEYRVFSEPAKCLEALAVAPAEIMFVDLVMTGMGGLEVLEQVRRRWPETTCIMVTGAAEKEDVVKALKLGAFDFIEKPVTQETLLGALNRVEKYRATALERDRYQRQLTMLAQQDSRRCGIESFVGESAALKKTLADIRTLHKNDKIPVLIVGESGTGKELVARAIHSGSERANRPFVPINCSAIPDTLAESLFFGHMRGSFTGALADKKGVFEMADGGTLFLDEIGDMHAELQVKLLRVLEDGIVEPVGSNRPQHVDVRVIAATNCNLDKKMEEGTFRKDLFFRLAAYRIDVPPLRDRTEDIAILARHFAKVLAIEMGLPAAVLSAEAVTAMEKYAFPGNVRELKNMVERALLMAGSDEIKSVHLELTNVRLGSGSGSKSGKGFALAGNSLKLSEVEDAVIRQAIDTTGGNIVAAARLLGITRTKLYRRLGKVGGAQ